MTNIYFLKIGNLGKIGITNNLVSRIYQHSRYFEIEPLLIFNRKTKYRNDAKRCESYIISRLKILKIKFFKREFFVWNNLMVEQIKKIMKNWNVSKSEFSIIKDTGFEFEKAFEVRE